MGDGRALDTRQASPAHDDLTRAPRASQTFRVRDWLDTHQDWLIGVLCLAALVGTEIAGLALASDTKALLVGGAAWMLNRGRVEVAKRKKLEAEKGEVSGDGK